eukprot:SAG22_NODE_2252_length_2785_cov_2.933730_1_plen_186_part_00
MFIRSLRPELSTTLAPFSVSPSSPSGSSCSPCPASLSSSSSSLSRFTKGKLPSFSMEHVRRHWTKRPWAYDTVSLDDRLDPQLNDDTKEYEVDSVSSRRYLHGKYKYAVTFKDWHEESPLRPKDDEYFAGCQKLLAEFDAKHPFGSLPSDKPEDARKYKEARAGTRTRRSKLINLESLDFLKFNI